MRDFNFRYQFHLHWKKITFCLLFLGVSSLGYSQRKHLNMVNSDKKKLHYGFQLGIFQSTLNVKTTDLGAGNAPDAYDVAPISRPGFSLGFLINFALADELWDIRLLPTVSFYEHQVDFTQKQGGDFFSSKSSISVIEFPVLVQYKSIRRNNTRMYLVAGLTPGIQVGGKNKAGGSNNLKHNPLNLSVTYGIGLDKYLEFVKFSPEIRFSHGLFNMFKPNDTIYSDQISNVSTNKVTLIINFEG